LTEFGMIAAMKAWILSALEGLSALRLEEIAEPVAGTGEVVLEVEFAALNPADRYLSEKQYPAHPPLPHVLGRDGVGRVVSVGPGVTGVAVGDRRAVLRGETGVSRHGTFAQRVAVAADCLIEAPRGWTSQQAAGASLVYLTAWQALTQWDDLPARAVVLVTGASGGVGVASVQLGAASGHTIIALSRSAEKREKLKTLGASEAFDPSDPIWGKNVLAFLKNRRVDLAIDNIGGALLPQVIETLGLRGRVSIVGRLAGPVPQFNSASLIFRRLRLGGVAVGSYGATDGQAAWKQIVATLAKRDDRPLIDHVFPFDQLPGAFERLANGPMGKVLLDVGRPSRAGTVIPKPQPGAAVPQSHAKGA
jgi:NADPH2:quinone reductase